MFQIKFWNWDWICVISCVGRWMCMHDPVDGWWGRPKPLPTKRSQGSACDHDPRTVCTCHVCYKYKPPLKLSNEVLLYISTSVPCRPKSACMPMTQLGGGGTKPNLPLSMPSVVMPRNDAHNRPRALLSSSSRYVILQGWIGKQAVIADHVLLLRQILGKKCLMLLLHIRIKNSKSCT